DAVSLTLTSVTLYAGVGSSRIDDVGATQPPNDYSDDTVQNGTLGFGGSITGDLKVVAIKAASASYLGIENDTGALSAELVGLDRSEERRVGKDRVTLKAIGDAGREKREWER